MNKILHFVLSTKLKSSESFITHLPKKYPKFTLFISDVMAQFHVRQLEQDVFQETYNKVYKSLVYFNCKRNEEAAKVKKLITVVVH